MCLNSAAKVSNVCYNIVKQIFHLCYKSTRHTAAYGRHNSKTPLLHIRPTRICNPTSLQRLYKMPPFTCQKSTFQALKGRLLEHKRRPFAKPLSISALRDSRQEHTQRALQESVLAGSSRKTEVSRHGDWKN